MSKRPGQWKGHLKQPHGSEKLPGEWSSSCGCFHRPYEQALHLAVIMWQCMACFLLFWVFQSLQACHQDSIMEEWARKKRVESHWTRLSKCQKLRESKNDGKSIRGWRLNQSFSRLGKTLPGPPTPMTAFQEYSSHVGEFTSHQPIPGERNEGVEGEQFFI